GSRMLQWGGRHSPRTRTSDEYDRSARSGRQARVDPAPGSGDGAGDGGPGPDRARRRRLRRLRRGRHPQGPRPATPDARRRGGQKDPGRRKKGAPLRGCACGRQKETRGPKRRALMSAVGAVAFTRRYWKCACGAGGSYAADELLGVEGQRYTLAVQK